MHPSQTGLPSLPDLILAHARKFKRADDRKYRQRVAHKVMELAAGLRTEAGKREANAERATRGIGQ